MSFNYYYQDELIALRKLGREFADRNPVLAPFFNTQGSDPDVERILEGFAFLSGRLRQKLDDEFPEITHALFNLLWPNYLRPIPAATIVEFDPKTNVSDSLFMPRGSEVESIPVDKTPCRFRTIYDTHVYPLSITGQHFIDHGNECGIALHMESLGTTFETLNIPSLRFYLSGEPVLARTLYFTLLNRVKEIRVVISDSQNKAQVIATMPPSALKQVGFKDDEGLIPYPVNTFSGYRILQEYFCFPEKFLFVDLEFPQNFPNKNAIKTGINPAKIELHFMLTDLPVSYESLSIDNWKLFCSPVVNLFTMDGSPLTLDQRQTEYRIVPEPRLPYHYSVYSVDFVGAWNHNGRGGNQYLPFESFQHDNANGENLAYYKLRLATSHKDGAPETYISFSKSNNSLLIPQDETISLELTCTNRELPRVLKAGDINTMAATTATPLTVRNITPVVPSCSPPADSDIFWRLLSNMSLNFVSLNNVGALRSILSAYDFRALHDKPKAKSLEKMLAGIIHIESKESDRIFKGLVLRGSQSEVQLNVDAFSCEGELYLFSSILNEFLALYSRINSFHQLIVKETVHGEIYKWPARLSKVTL